MSRSSKFYSFEEAKIAAKKLGISSQIDYNLRYKSDPLLPSSPATRYTDEWRGWDNYLGKTSTYFYSTYAEAQKSAKNLGIKSKTAYAYTRKEDPLLPSQPDTIYPNEWGGWKQFLGTNWILYPTHEEARQATVKLGIQGRVDYINRYKQDPRLPSSPESKYKNNWQGWEYFTGVAKSNKEPREPPQKKYIAGSEAPYPNLGEAQQATQRLSINTHKEYRELYKVDPRLPSAPDERYRSDWMSWSHFLRNELPLYTFKEARKVIAELGLKRASEYMLEKERNPRLPSNPRKYFASEWVSWKDFLGQQMLGFSEAKKVVRKLNITTFTEYQHRYKEVNNLPSSPYKFYNEEWLGWSDFVGFPEKRLYTAYKDAKNSAAKLGIANSMEYVSRYQEDPRLPQCPLKQYPSEWRGWKQFLLPYMIKTLDELKRACKILQIRNSKHYREIRSEFPFLPSKPDKKFADEWVSWFQLLDIPTPYDFKTAREITHNYKITTINAYKQLCIKLADPRLPRTPHEVYKDQGWIHWYDYFGTPAPYKVRYFDPELTGWGEYICEFLKSARAGDTKEKDLCEFVREYIVPQKLPYSPLDFLVVKDPPVNAFVDLLNTTSVTRKKKWLASVTEFLKWILETYMTIEDPDTGEISRVGNARNPFRYVNFDSEIAPPIYRGETDKLALPYEYTKRSRDWIFPPDAHLANTSYAELVHLHNFAADWEYLSEEDEIDASDADCITKEVNGKKYLWNPCHWTYTYALMQLPARGRQIVYCDSGEADFEIAQFEDKKLHWVINEGPLKGQTNRQAMVSQSSRGEFGVYYTSNKTHLHGKGYSIPYMPTELAYWLIKLRNWQQKFNPIKKATLWFDCKRTYLNDNQRKNKGANCFLFREFKGFEPGHFSGRLANRLAAALFFSGKAEVSNAQFKETSYRQWVEDSVCPEREFINISHFDSQYTPHAMRVSLINSYVNEFGLPIEVVMKLAGHSSIIMTVVYLKSDKSGLNLHKKMSKGEKIALQNSSETIQRQIENQRIEECIGQLTAKDPNFLSSLNNNRPSSSYLFKDYGICPVGGAFCHEGGSFSGPKSNVRLPVTAGHLGEQNCIACRFFITGPAFIGGLAALGNEVSYCVHEQSQKHSSLLELLDSKVEKIDVLSHKIYENIKNGEPTDKAEEQKSKLQSERRKLNSEIESRAKKLDLLMNDLNMIYHHLENCQKLINAPSPKQTTKSYQLIKSADFEVNLEAIEASLFHQLCEVCENAEIYQSCLPSTAVTKRSQMLDKMMKSNNISPTFFELNEEEQLKIGNQMVELMLVKLSSWEKLDRLMKGSLSFDDLTIENCHLRKEISDIFSVSVKQLGSNE